MFLLADAAKALQLMRKSTPKEIKYHRFLRHQQGVSVKNPVGNICDARSHRVKRLERLLASAAMRLEHGLNEVSPATVAKTG
jgi:hypothetical protein